MSKRSTLFVRGISPSTTAVELAEEFEKYGALKRCDIPKSNGSSKG